MIGYRIKELMELRGFDEQMMKAAMGWDDDECREILMGIRGLTAEDLVDIAGWLSVPVWALLPDMASSPRPLRIMVEKDGRFFETSDPADLDGILR